MNSSSNQPALPMTDETLPGASSVNGAGVGSTTSTSTSTSTGAEPTSGGHSITGPGPGPGVLGWREWVSLPDLGVTKIKAKIDSGARTSAIHASDITFFVAGGKKMVRFKVYPFQRNTKKFKLVEAKLIEGRMVKSSVGSTTFRPVIMTNIKIGKLEWPVEVTLVNRDLMGFRMLIGRQAIRKHFLIDPGRSYMVGKKKRGLMAQLPSKMISKIFKGKKETKKETKKEATGSLE